MAAEKVPRMRHIRLVGSGLDRFPGHHMSPLYIVVSDGNVTQVISIWNLGVKRCHTLLNSCTAAQLQVMTFKER